MVQNKQVYKQNIFIILNSFVLLSTAEECTLISTPVIVGMNSMGFEITKATKSKRKYINK